jgi:hypothetical protein
MRAWMDDWLAALGAFHCAAAAAWPAAPLKSWLWQAKWPVHPLKAAVMSSPGV